MSVLCDGRGNWKMYVNASAERNIIIVDFNTIQAPFVKSKTFVVNDCLPEFWVSASLLRNYNCDCVGLY